MRSEEADYEEVEPLPRKKKRRVEKREEPEEELSSTTGNHIFWQVFAGVLLAILLAWCLITANMKSESNQEEIRKTKKWLDEHP